MCFGGGGSGYVPPPTPKAETPLPQKDDQATRRAAALETNKRLAMSSGRASNDLGMEEKLGEYQPAETRQGNEPVMGTSLMTG